VAVGVHKLSAQATDNQGATATSGVVSITVTTSNAPPLITITSPTNGAVFVAPADLTIQASASDPDGSVAKVEFFDGTGSLGVTTNMPFQITAALAVGTHSLSAQATDNLGATANSTVVSISVTNSPPPQPASTYVQHNLVSDLPGLADVTDTNLVNPWGIATSASSPFWISENHSGLSTLYNSTGGVVSLVVTIPPPANGQSPAAPTGIVFNGNTNDFLVASNQPAHFIFATEDGTISGWNGGAHAVLKIDNSSSNAVYKGLALATNSTNTFLYAADFHNSRVDVFDSAFQPVSLPGAFTDSSLPAGYAPFGIHSIGGSLYVTYALQDSDAHDDVAGAGHGFVNVFDATGTMLKRLVSQAALNSPWGLAKAPLGFGSFSQALLIGNFGDGMINAFDPASGVFLGHLNDTNGTALSIQGLWGLKFGNGGQGGESLKLYFTAGIPGGGSVEDHGLFGSIAAVSDISLSLSAVSSNSVTLVWSAGIPPFLVQKKTSLSDQNWTNALTTTNTTALVPTDSSTAFYRVLDHAQ
jgi:uncharacterized protein (TIGR03118 family)